MDLPMKSCRTCRHWGMKDDEYRQRCGEFVADDCRRHAPQPGPMDPRMDYSARSWPKTKAEDWCGDHEPLKPAKIEFVGNLPTFGLRWMMRKAKEGGK